MKKKAIDTISRQKKQPYDANGTGLGAMTPYIFAKALSLAMADDMFAAVDATSTGIVDGIEFVLLMVSAVLAAT